MEVQGFKHLLPTASSSFWEGVSSGLQKGDFRCQGLPSEHKWLQSFLAGVWSLPPTQSSRAVATLLTAGGAPGWWPGPALLCICALTIYSLAFLFLISISVFFWIFCFAFLNHSISFLKVYYLLFSLLVTFTGIQHTSLTYKSLIKSDTLPFPIQCQDLRTLQCHWVLFMSSVLLSLCFKSPKSFITTLYSQYSF